MFEDFGKMAQDAMDSAGRMASDAVKGAEALTDKVTGRDSLERNETYEAAKARVEQLRKVPDDFLQVMQKYDAENGTQFYQSLQMLTSESGEEVETVTETLMLDALDRMQNSRIEKMFEENFGEKVKSSEVENGRVRAVVEYKIGGKSFDLIVRRDADDDSWHVGDIPGNFYPSHGKLPDLARDINNAVFAVGAISNSFERAKYVDKQPFKAVGSSGINIIGKDGKEYFAELSEPLTMSVNVGLANLMNEIDGVVNGDIKFTPAPPPVEQSIPEDAYLADARQALEEANAPATAHESVEPIINSAETFRQALMANPDKYLRTEDSQMGVENVKYVTISLPRDGKSPAVIFSRIQHFIGKKGKAAVGLDRPENYILTDAKFNKDYQWDGETWVDESGKRCLVYGGGTNFILNEKPADSQLVA